MARDQVDLTPIETRDELVAWFEAGSKPKAEFRIGTEHEKFAFTLEGHRPVPYEGRRSIRALLEGIQHLLGWEPIIEDGNIIGMFDVTGGGAISLEPGGQFELSGAPVETVHQTCSELMAHLAQLKEIGDFASVLDTAIPAHDSEVISRAVNTVDLELRELTEQFPEHTDPSVTGGQEERVRARAALKDLVLRLNRIGVAARE